MESTITVKALKKWLERLPEDTKLGYIIEDEVVEVHADRGLGHFCLASGASHIKGDPWGRIELSSRINTEREKQ